SDGRPGALVVSIDFELSWGNLAKARDNENHRARVLGSRLAIPRILNRIMTELSATARQRRIYHLWWHPSDFGAYTSENLVVLNRILERFRVLSEPDEMRSLAMRDVTSFIQQA